MADEWDREIKYQELREAEISLSDEKIQSNSGEQCPETEYDLRGQDEQRKREGRRIFGRIGYAYAAFLGLTLLAQFGLSALFFLGVIPKKWMTANVSVLLSMAAMYLIAFPVFWLLIRRIPKVEGIQKQRWTPGALAVVFLICMAAIYIGNIIGQLLMFFVSVLTGIPMKNSLEALIMNMDLPVIFLFTVIIAPVMEELIYRKILIDRIRQFGEGICVVISGILFGLAHGNFYQFFYAFMLGVIFAYIYVKSGKVGYTIVFHMVINFIGGIFPILLLRLMKYHVMLGTLVTLTFGMLVLGFLGVGIALFIMNFRKIDFRPGKVVLPKKGRFQMVFLNGGMVLYLLACGVLFWIG